MKYKVIIIMLIISLALISIGCSKNPTTTIQVDGTLISCVYHKKVQGAFWAYRIYKISLDDGTSFNILSDPEQEDRVDPLTLTIGTHYNLTLLSAGGSWTDTWWITAAS